MGHLGARLFPSFSARRYCCSGCCTRNCCMPLPGMSKSFPQWPKYHRNRCRRHSRRSWIRYARPRIAMHRKCHSSTPPPYHNTCHRRRSDSKGCLVYTGDIHCYSCYRRFLHNRLLPSPCSSKCSHKNRRCRCMMCRKQLKSGCMMTYL